MDNIEKVEVKADAGDKIIENQVDFDESCILEEPHISVICIDDTIVEEEAVKPEDSGKTVMSIRIEEQSIYKELKNCQGMMIQFFRDMLDVEKKVLFVEEKDEEQTLEIKEREASEEDLNFSIDTTPNNKLPQRHALPIYSKYEKAKNQTKVESSNPSRPSRSACFNCGEAHSMRECTKPKDFGRINRARSQFSQTSYQKPERYHNEIQQKFGHFKPGLLSPELRAALGLRAGQIPAHIYRMRILGYPPGWMEDAKVFHSGLTLFDSKGTEILGSDGEEGELEYSKHKFDISKINDYPGYNVEPEGNYYEEECKKHNAPPMMKVQMKEFMIEALKDNTAPQYKRRKLRNLPGENQLNLTSGDPVDMDVEDGEIDDSFCGPLLPPSTDENSDSIIDLDSSAATVDRSISPTMGDLKQEQEKLLAALNSSELANTTASTEILDTTTEIAWKIIDEVGSELDESALSQSTSGSDFITPTHHRSTKSEVTGTPVLQFSPYDKLPSGEQFSVGVCDVINFENLPDSTGKYEKMRGLLDRVRTRLSDIHREDN